VNRQVHDMVQDAGLNSLFGARKRAITSGIVEELTRYGCTESGNSCRLGFTKDIGNKTILSLSFDKGDEINSLDTIVDVTLVKSKGYKRVGNRTIGDVLSNLDRISAGRQFIWGYHDNDGSGKELESSFFGLTSDVLKLEETLRDKACSSVVLEKLALAKRMLIEAESLYFSEA
jgi:hypothetical protein